MTKIKNILVAAAALVIFSNITNAQAVKASYSVNAEEPPVPTITVTENSQKVP